MKQIKVSNLDRMILIDDADYDTYSASKWHVVHVRGRAVGVARNVYVPKAEGKSYKQKMHRLMLGLTDPKEQVDHIDGNVFNNQRDNLRACNNFQNSCNKPKGKLNTTGYLGVSKYGKNGLFRAVVKAGKTYWCQTGFKTAEEAARARDVKAKELHGEFAQLNFK